MSRLPIEVEQTAIGNEGERWDEHRLRWRTPGRHRSQLRGDTPEISPGGNVNITIVVISNGDKGFQHNPSTPYEEVTRRRNADATRVAEALGGRYVCMGQPDEYIRDTDEARNQLVDILREAQADVVFTLPPVDYNIDHMVASQITFHAVMLAPVPTIFTDHDPLPSISAMCGSESVNCSECTPARC
jgi:hypothetical protein